MIFNSLYTAAIFDHAIFVRLPSILDHIVMQNNNFRLFQAIPHAEDRGLWLC